MDHIPLTTLFGVLIVLLIVSALFSGSETAMMALNRYRLRHLSRAGHRGAQRAERLLQRPDRLIGVVLLGNNLVNNFAAALATLIALRVGGESGPIVGTILLTVALLIFAEVTPKTFAALRPERVAFPAAYALSALMWPLTPAVRVIVFISNGLLRICGLSTASQVADHTLSRDELKTLLYESGPRFSPKHRSMLLRILDLEKVTVEDLMVPRAEIEVIDLNDDWSDILHQLLSCPHTRVPVCRDSLDQMVGILNLRKLMHVLRDSTFDRERLLLELYEPYYVPDSTAVSQQLLAFQARRERIALVVNEYGDTIGLVSVEDILQEIVGEFTDKAPTAVEDVYPQDDGSYLVEGSANIRELARKMSWELPLGHSKTLNGAILEYLEDIPVPGMSIRLGDYPIEIVQTSGNAVKIARVLPPLVRSGGEATRTVGQREE